MLLCQDKRQSSPSSIVCLFVLLRFFFCLFVCLFVCFCLFGWLVGFLRGERRGVGEGEGVREWWFARRYVAWEGFFWGGGRGVFCLFFMHCINGHTDIFTDQMVISNNNSMTLIAIMT